MRWSPFVTISTILAVTSIFEGVAAAPLDVVREVRVGVKQSIVKRNPPNPPKITVTLGPKGRSVVLDKKFGAPTITHDGVTIAKEVELHGHQSANHSPVKGKTK